MLKRIALIGPLLALAAAGAAETPCVPAGRWLAPATASLLTQDDVIAGMARRPVVLLGETHTSAEDHRWQLHTIAALHGQNPNMVLGFEAFPRRLAPRRHRRKGIPRENPLERDLAFRSRSLPAAVSFRPPAPHPDDRA